MRVTVVDRGTTSAYQFKLRTVNIGDNCPVCGGPRGPVVPRQFCEDGDWYMVDTWRNPCGHVDTYKSALAEAEEGTP